MLKRGALLASLFFFVAVAGAQAAPGHGPSEPDEKINKKVARQELKKLTKITKDEMKMSKSIWQQPAIQKVWQEEKVCIKNTLDALDPDGPITDVQTLYTVSAIRATGLHILGPDGKTHTSFRNSHKRFKTAARVTKTEALADAFADKYSWMPGMGGLPKYSEGLCSWLARWQEAGSPDLAAWAKLWRYPAIANLAGIPIGESYPDYQLSDVLYLLRNPKSEEDFLAFDKFASWLSGSLPYAQGYKASLATWKNWLGEDYPEPGYGW